MDVVLQSRPPEYGLGRFHPKAASGHGCITVLLLGSVEIGGITQRHKSPLWHWLYDASRRSLRPGTRPIQATVRHPGRRLHGKPKKVQRKLPSTSQAASCRLDQPTENGADHQQNVATALTKLTSPGVSSSLTNSAGGWLQGASA